MKFAECMIVWTANRDIFSHRNTMGEIAVGPWPDNTGWSKPYVSSVGACFAYVHDMTEKEQITQMLLEFHSAVVRDRIDPHKAHQAFLAIDEYRQVIALDIEGAEPNDE